MLTSIIIDWNQWISSRAAWIFDNFIYWLRAECRLSNRSVLYCDRLWDIGRCYGRAIVLLADRFVAQPPGCTVSWPSEHACFASRQLAARRNGPTPKRPHEIAKLSRLPCVSLSQPHDLFCYFEKWLWLLISFSNFLVGRTARWSIDCMSLNNFKWD